MQNSRIGYIDITRGLGMIAVIWGHIMLSGWSYILAYAFDIPMFFFFSGMMYSKNKNDKLSSLLKRMLNKLIIPYLIFSVVTWIFWALYNLLLHEDFSVILKSLLETFLAQGSGEYLLHNVPLWFVTCLCVVQLIYFFISKKNIFITVFMSLLCAALGYLLVFYDYTYLPWNIEAALSALIFFSMGNIFTEKYGRNFFPDLIKKNKIVLLLIYVVATILFVVLGLWNGHISLGSNDFGKNVIILYIVGFLGIYSALYISTMLDNFGDNIVLKYIKWIGKNSFYFMSVHFPISVLINVLLSFAFKISRDDLQLSMSYSLISFAITMLITSFTVVLINKFKEKTKIKFI